MDTPRELTPEAQVIYDDLKEKMGAFTPDFELWYKAQLAADINQLKKEKNAIVLGHNYMEPVLFHTVSDYVGDSLYLSRVAAKADADIIIFAGVEFMAETAKILNPTKTVLIPSTKAGCSLAEAITAEDVRWLKEQYPGVPVVTYVNTYADVKAETDICCTSSNAVKVVESLDTDQVIFLPDEFLAGNVARETGKSIIFPTKDEPDGDADPNLEYQMIGWKGRCMVHEQYTVEDITAIRADHPDVVVLAHPECSPEVVEASDYSGSTTQMINFVQDNDLPEVLLLTECSMGDNIMAQNPDANLLRLCSVRCPHMNQIQMQDIMNALKFNQYEVTVPEEIRVKALASVERMIAIG